VWQADSGLGSACNPVIAPVFKTGDRYPCDGDDGFDSHSLPPDFERNMAIVQKICYVMNSSPDQYWDMSLNLDDPMKGVIQSWSEKMSESEILALYVSRGFSPEKVSKMIEEAKREMARVKFYGRK
jgi:hypothetical protein